MADTPSSRPRKRTITAADKAAAARLRSILGAMPKGERPTQQQMAEAWEGPGEANQSLISQYLNGGIALNYRAVLSFARQLGCKDTDIRDDLPEQQYAGPISPPPRVSTPATPPDYVRVQQLDAEAGMGDGIENLDNPEIIRAIDFAPGYIRSLMGYVPAAGRLRLITGSGDSMMPVIQPGDTVVVDTGVTHFDGDGLYLINMGNGQQIKRLLDRGAIYVASENKSYGDPFPAPDGTLIGGKVYLRNRIERFN